MSVRAIPAARTSDGARPWLPAVIVTGAIVLVLLACAAFAAVRVIGDLESMQADVHRMSDRLATLDAMNARLSKLKAMSNDLGALRLQLTSTVSELRRIDNMIAADSTTLDKAQTSIGAMSASLSTMDRRLRTIDSMGTDIHQMAHKVSDSFLFRGVK